MGEGQKGKREDEGGREGSKGKWRGGVSRERRGKGRVG